MKNILILAAVLTLGTASAQTGNVFDRYEVEAVTTGVNLVNGASVTGYTTLSGQKYLGQSDGVRFYGTVSVGALGTLADRNSYGAAVFGAELLAKQNDFAVFAGVNNYRQLGTVESFRFNETTTWRVGIRYGNGLVR